MAEQVRLRDGQPRIGEAHRAQHDQRRVERADAAQRLELLIGLLRPERVQASCVEGSLEGRGPRGIPPDPRQALGVAGLIE
jgi:hypothetical protein